MPWSPRFLAPLLFLLACSQAAQAQEEVTRKDHSALLFSNRLQFNDRGEPLVSIGLMDAQETISFSSDGLIINPSGPEGPKLQVEGKRDWTVTVSKTHAASFQWRLRLDSAPTGDFARVREELRQLRDQGLSVSMEEVGALFGVLGQMLDTRETVFLLEEVFASESAAGVKGEELARMLGHPVSVERMIQELPEGTLILTSKDREVQIEARNAIWFEAPNGASVKFEQVEHSRGFRWHGREDRSYQGSFYATVDSGGRLGLGNILTAEKLLEGLVPAEMYTSAPLEALKAQAVTARGELLSKIGRRHLTDPWLICAEQHCQVYKGLKAEHPRSTKAVKETRGLVLFSEGRLADARYSSNCGGHSENSETAWPEVKAPELRGRVDSAGPAPADLSQEANAAAFIKNPPRAHCNIKGGTFRWTEKIPARKLNELVNKSLRLGAISTIKPLARGVSGRIFRLAVGGAGGEALVEGELVIRRLFGGLKSSMFIVTPPATPGGDWIFEGGGFGHGVGMCQHGAMQQAKDGQDFKSILQHYYQQSRVEPLY
jgi:stage II sporulation protein D